MLFTVYLLFLFNLLPLMFEVRISSVEMHVTTVFAHLSPFCLEKTHALNNMDRSNAVHHCDIERLY